MAVLDISDNSFAFLPMTLPPLLKSLIGKVFPLCGGGYMVMLLAKRYVG